MISLSAAKRPVPRESFVRIPRLRQVAFILAVSTTVLVGACDSGNQVQTGKASTALSAPGVSLGTFNTAPGGKEGEWTSQAGDYANSRFSQLDQINDSNVANLKVAWTFSDGSLYGHEGAPLVKDDTMYVVSPFPDRAYALDLTKPGDRKSVV